MKKLLALIFMFGCISEEISVDPQKTDSLSERSLASEETQITPTIPLDPNTPPQILKFDVISRLKDAEDEVSSSRIIAHKGDDLIALWSVKDNTELLGKSVSIFY